MRNNNKNTNENALLDAYIQNNNMAPRRQIVDVAEPLKLQPKQYRFENTERQIQNSPNDEMTPEEVAQIEAMLKGLMNRKEGQYPEKVVEKGFNPDPNMTPDENAKIKVVLDAIMQNKLTGDTVNKIPTNLPQGNGGKIPTNLPGLEKLIPLENPNGRSIPTKLPLKYGNQKSRDVREMLKYITGDYSTP